MDEARHALTVLTRLAGRRPQEALRLEQALSGRLERLGRIALEVAIESSDPMGRVLERMLRQEDNLVAATALVGHLPRDTTALREAAVAITELAQRAATGPQRHVLALELSERLSAAGERDRCLEVAAQGCAALLADPQANQDLRLTARAHNVYSAALRDVGRYDQALETEQLAVGLRRQFGDDARSRADLATSLVELSGIEKEVGHRHEAAASGREAVDLLQALAQDDQAFLPRLASAQSNLATFLVDLNEADEAVAVQRQSLDLYEDLAERNPDGYRVYVGIGHNNLANNLSLLRRFDEALPHVEIAVQVFGELAKTRPSVYGEYLAIAFNSLSNRLNDLGRVQEAIDAASTSVGAMRALDSQHRDVFGPLLARSLHTLAYRQFEAGILADAQTACDEAITIRRGLYARNARSAGVPLSLSLGLRSSILSNAEQHAQACDAVTEAFQLVTHMAATHFGKALSRETKEIGGRYLKVLGLAGQPTDAQLLETARTAADIEDIGPIS